jgi:RNA polymerase sigma-32 factor
MTPTQSLAISPQTLAAAIANPGSLGSIQAYISTVNRLPMLTAEQETNLARRLQQDGDIEAARELILSHLRLVVSVARQYLGYGLPHADLIQEGNVGLMKAVKRYDPDRGVRLMTFAVHWIKAEIHEFVVRNWRMVKVATTKAQRKLFFNLRSMRGDGETLDTQRVEDIAKKLNVRESDVREMEVRLSGREMPIDAPSDDSEAFAPISYLSDEGYDDPVAVIARQDQATLESEGLSRAIAQLDPRSQRIVQARWLAEDENATLADLAQEFGVSAERIRQIEVAALKKMRTNLAVA